MISNNALISLTRLNKPIGILLLLWPTLIALWIAGKGNPHPFIVFIFIAGVVIMRSAGCVVNDLVDKKFDAEVSRTCHRPLVLGSVTGFSAKCLFVFLLTLALVLVLQLNTYTIGLSLIAVLVASIYPFMKRYTHWPQVVLGVAFGCGIPMAYAALNAPFGTDTALLCIANFCWIVAYDTQYAMVDRADDIKAGVKSTAVLFGRYDCILVGVFQGLALIFFACLGRFLNMGMYYHIALLVVAALFIYHQYLIKNRMPTQCFKAFKHNHYVGMILFLGVLFSFGETLP